MSVTFSLVANEVVSEEQSDELSINLSNINAADFLRRFEMWMDASNLFGTWEMKEIDYLLSKVTVLRNKPKDKASLLKETLAFGNFIECGRDESYVDTRLEQFHRLLMAAKVGNTKICFG